MGRIGLHSVKDSCVLQKCGDYVVSLGKKLWIFRTDGSFVAQCAEVRYPKRVLFLPPEEIFVEGGTDRKYHHISLSTGLDIWNAPMAKERMMQAKDFVLSPDQKFIYDMYYSKAQWVVLRVSLEEQTVATKVIPHTLFATVAIYTDEQGILYALQTHHLTSDGKTSQYGIFKIDWRDSSEPQFSWVRLWEGETQMRWKYSDGKYVLREDYSVFDLQTLETFSLLEGDDDWKPSVYGMATCVYIPEQNLLMAYHFYDDGHVIIDCSTRKRISHYALKLNNDSIGFQGCLVNDEYWVGTTNGIIKKPFPLFETVEPNISPYWHWAKE